MNLTTRQIQRLVNRYCREGAAGLTSRHRVRPSNRQLAPGLANLALTIIRERYAAFGPTLACEKLREHHGVRVGTETVPVDATRASLLQHGKPVRFYSDQATIFRCNNKHAAAGDGHTRLHDMMHRMTGEATVDSPSPTCRKSLENRKACLNRNGTRGCHFDIAANSLSDLSEGMANAQIQRFVARTRLNRVTDGVASTVLVLDASISGIEVRTF
jgi:hypothetical protein